MTLAPANAFVNIEDPNPRANLRRLIFHADRHYTWIRGCDAAGRRLGGFTLRVPTDQLEVLALALRKYAPASWAGWRSTLNTIISLRS